MNLFSVVGVDDTKLHSVVFLKPLVTLVLLVHQHCFAATWLENICWQWKMSTRN